MLMDILFVLKVELTGNSIFNYVHQEDHADILEQLSSAGDEMSEGQFQERQGLFQCQGQQPGNALFNQGMSRIQ